MSDEKPGVGTIVWRDLTVSDAEGARDFYEAVVGWDVKPVKMDGYSDFSMTVPGTGEDMAGVCHSRGTNADLPPQWLIYIVVADADRSAKTCVEMGGEVLAGPRPMGDGLLCVIRDPQGAVCALYQP